MNERCGTCKHWERLQYEWQGPIAPIILDSRKQENNWHGEKAPGEWGWCKKAGEFGPKRSDRFYVVDGSEYIASLRTRSDFGCVEWQPSGRAEHQ